MTMVADIGGKRGWGRWLIAAIAFAGLLWGALMCVNPKGLESRVFFERGAKWFGDFESTRICAEFGYANDRQEALTACYPALGPALARPFPLTRAGGACFVGLGIFLWAAALAVLMREKARNVGWTGTALVVVGGGLSSIMLHAFEWGNQIVYAAAAVTLFLAWRDSKRGWKRGMAAASLAVASVLKLVPALLAVLYVVDWRRERDGGEPRKVWRDVGLYMVLGAVLFVVPFLWYGGWEGFCQWLSNARANAVGYAHRGAWGAVPIGRTARLLMHVDVSGPWTGLVFERAANIVLGCAALLLAWWRMWKWREETAFVWLLLAGAMLLVPGNMHVYTGLYLLPVMALRLESRMGWFEAGCWFAMLCPLQIPFGAGCLNHPLANVAFLALLGMAFAENKKSPN